MNQERMRLVAVLAIIFAVVGLVGQRFGFDVGMAVLFVLFAVVAMSGGEA